MWDDSRDRPVWSDHPFEVDENRWLFLGWHERHAWYAVDISEFGESDLPTATAHLWQSGHQLDDFDASVLAYARGLVLWHRNHRFCPGCGNVTAMENAGHQRRCNDSDCRELHFPRTDPAVITAVTCDDAILLGRQPQWPDRRYSVIAGFVEPGESLEQTVARETFEETGVKVHDIRYHSSQPWPFPRSIMIGFTAQARTQERAPTRDDELEKVRWFGRDELRRLTKSGEVVLPTPVSISRRLVDDFLGFT